MFIFVYVLVEVVEVLFPALLGVITTNRRHYYDMTLGNVAGSCQIEILLLPSLPHLLCTPSVCGRMDAVEGVQLRRGQF